MSVIKKDGMYKLNSNEDLFNDWNQLGTNIQRLRNIVQNDVELPGLEIEGWVKATKIVQQELNDMIMKTQKYIANNLQEVNTTNEKYPFAYEDSAGEIHRDYTTEEEWPNWLQQAEVGVVEILKYPKFPSKE